MRHTEATVAATIAELPNGTKLAVLDFDGEWNIIWRDDSPLDDGEWWYHDRDEEPMSFYEQVKYAKAVYELSGPLAEFARQSLTDMTYETEH